MSLEDLIILNDKIGKLESQLEKAEKVINNVRDIMEDLAIDIVSDKDVVKVVHKSLMEYFKNKEQR